jgi:hypothetical protein
VTPEPSRYAQYYSEARWLVSLIATTEGVPAIDTGDPTE